MKGGGVIKNYIKPPTPSPTSIFINGEKIIRALPTHGRAKACLYFEDLGWEPLRVTTVSRRENSYLFSM